MTHRHRAARRRPALRRRQPTPPRHEASTCTRPRRHDPRPARPQRLGQDQPDVAGGVAAAAHGRRGAAWTAPTPGRTPTAWPPSPSSARTATRRRLEGRATPSSSRRAAPGLGRRPTPTGSSTSSRSRTSRSPTSPGASGPPPVHHGPRGPGADHDVRRGPPRHGRPSPVRVLRRGARRLHGPPPHRRSCRPTTSTRWRRCSARWRSSTGAGCCPPTPTACGARAPRSSARPRRSTRFVAAAGLERLSERRSAARWPASPTAS